MKLHKFLTQNEFNCKTCKMQIQFAEILNHVSHDVRVRLKAKHFIIDIIFYTCTTIIPIGILLYTVFQLLDVIQRIGGLPSV